MLVWNIGGEGQLLMGAIFAAGVAIAIGPDMPAVVALPLVILAGALGGAVWASVAAVPRVYLGTNEIITTLMLNFIALFLMQYLIFDDFFGSFSPWRDPEATQFPQGRPIPDVARLPEFFNRLDWGFWIAVGVAVLAWLLISKTGYGFQYRVVGDSSDTARYAGIGVKQKILSVFLMSGASAGLAGSILVAGILGRMDPRSLNLGLGFAGIIVAALARLNPLAVVPVAILLGALRNAGPALQAIGVPSETALMLEGAILLFAVAGEFFISNRIRRPERDQAKTTDTVEAASSA
jgi:simple sugar transport system permease protein